MVVIGSIIDFSSYSISAYMGNYFLNSFILLLIFSSCSGYKSASKNKQVNFYYHTQPSEVIFQGANLPAQDFLVHETFEVNLPSNENSHAEAVRQLIQGSKEIGADGIILSQEDFYEEEYEEEYSTVDWIGLAASLVFGGTYAVSDESNFEYREIMWLSCIAYNYNENGILSRVPSSIDIITFDEDNGWVEFDEYGNITAQIIKNEQQQWVLDHLPEYLINNASKGWKEKTKNNQTIRKFSSFDNIEPDKYIDIHFDKYTNQIEWIKIETDYLEKGKATSTEIINYYYLPNGRIERREISDNQDNIIKEIFEYNASKHLVRSHFIGANDELIALVEYTYFDAGHIEDILKNDGQRTTPSTPF